MWNRSRVDMATGPRRVGHYVPHYTDQYRHTEPSWNNLTLGYRLRRGGHFSHDPWYKFWLPFGYHNEFHVGQDPRIYGWYNPIKYYQFGRLDFKNHFLGQTPSHLLAENWKPVTEEEVRANQERKEILGRNRRYYWKLELNPKYGEHHFLYTTSDAQWTKYNRAFMQMYQMFMKQNIPKGERIKWHLLLWILPLTIGYLLGMLWYTDGEINPVYAPVVNKYGNNPHKYYFEEHMPYNALTHENGFFSYILSIFFSSIDNMEEMYAFRASKYREITKGNAKDEKWDNLRTKGHHRNDKYMRRVDGSSGIIDPSFFGNEKLD